MHHNATDPDGTKRGVSLMLHGNRGAASYTLWMDAPREPTSSEAYTMNNGLLALAISLIPLAGAGLATRFC